MKFQTTLAFTLLLLVAMVGAGTMSALYGFSLGFDALQGVRQPEGNPAQQLVRSRKSESKDSDLRGMDLISEREIIVEVYDKIYAKEQALKKDPAANSPQPNSNFVKLPDEPDATKANESSTASVFPLSNTASNIRFEVSNSRLLGT